MARRPRSRAAQAGTRRWGNQFGYEPIGALRQKEAQRTVSLVQTALNQKGFTTGIPTHGAASPLPKPPSPAQQKEVDQRKQNRGGGGIFGGLKSFAGDVGGGIANVAQQAGRNLTDPTRLLDVANDPASALPSLAPLTSIFRAAAGGQATPLAQPLMTGLDAGTEYVGKPAFGVLGGLTEAQRKPIYGANGEIVGYYRDPGLSDTKSIPGAVGQAIRHPRREYGQARQATREYFQNPAHSEAENVVGQAVLDPTLYIGPAGASRALKLAGRGKWALNAAEAAKTGKPLAPWAVRGAAGVLENPRFTAATSVAGAAAAAQFGEKVPGFRKQPKALQVIEGAILGSASPAAGRAAVRAARAGAPAIREAARNLPARALEGEPQMAGITKAQRAGQEVNPKPDVTPEPYMKDIETVRTNRYVQERVKTEPRGPKAAREIAGTSRTTGKRIHFGDLKTPQRWLEETEDVLTPEEIDAAAGWYREGRPKFVDMFGEEDAQRFEDAFMIGNRRTPVETALTNVQRAEDLRLGKPPMKIAGTKSMQKAILAALRGDFTEGVNQKISDFLDSIRGKLTRTWMGDDPAGGQPFVADVWSVRDAGYVDPVMNDLFGLDLADDLLDKKRAGPNVKPGSQGIAPNADQYETVVKWGNDLKDYLNDIQWRGRNDWTAAEAQAVGWTKMRKAAGLGGGNIDAAFAQNIRRGNFELAFGKGSPLEKRHDFYALDPDQRKQVTDEVLERVVDWVQKNIEGVRIIRNDSAYGGWADSLTADINPSWNLDILASPETADDVFDAIGYLAQQSEVVVTRPLASGKTKAVDIHFPDPEMSTDRAFLNEFWKLLSAKMGKDVGGFSPQPKGVRVANLGQPWKADFRQRMLTALNEIEDELGLERDALGFRDNINLEAKRPGNDWSTPGNGYLSGLGSRGRSDLQRALQATDPERTRWVDEAFARVGAGQGRKGGPIARAARAAVRAATKGLEGEAPALGVTRRIEPEEPLFHGARTGFEGEPKVSRQGELGRAFYTTTEAGKAERGAGLAEGYARGKSFGNMEAADPTLVELRAREGSDLLMAGKPVTPDEMARIRAAIPEQFREEFEQRLEQARNYWPSTEDGESLNAIDYAFEGLGSKQIGERTINGPSIMRETFDRAGFHGLASEGPYQTQQGWFDPAKSLAVRAINRLTGGEAPTAGVTRTIRPGEEFYHGSPYEPVGPMRGQESGIGGAGFSISPDPQVASGYAVRGGDNSRIPDEMAGKVPSNVQNLTPTEDLKLLSQNVGESVTFEEFTSVKNAMPPETQEIFDRVWRETRQQGESTDTGIFLLGAIEDSLVEAGVLRPRPDIEGLRAADPNADIPRVFKEWQNENGRAVRDVMEKAGFHGTEALGANYHQEAWIYRPNEKLQTSWVRRAMRALTDDPGQVMSMVDQRRARMAKGGSINKDWRAMPANEVAEVLGWDAADVEQLRLAARMERAGEMTGAQLEAFNAVKKHLWDEYGQRYGKVDPETGEFKKARPVRGYKKSREAQYAEIDEFAAERGLDPDAETGNILTSADEADLEYAAPHEQAGEARPIGSATESLEDLATGMEQGQIPPPEVRARTGPENLPRIDDPGFRTGYGEGGDALANIGKSLVPFRSPLGIAGRAGAGYASALLEGEDQETALERAIMMAAPAAVGRAGLRAAARAGRALEETPEGALGVRGGLGRGMGDLPEPGKSKKPPRGLEWVGKGKKTPPAFDALKKSLKEVPEDADAIAAMEDEMGLGTTPAIGRPIGIEGTPAPTAAMFEPGALEDVPPREPGAFEAPGEDVPPAVRAALRQQQELRALEQRQGREALTPGRQAPAAGFPEGREAGVTEPFGGTQALETQGPREPGRTPSTEPLPPGVDERRYNDVLVSREQRAIAEKSAGEVLVDHIKQRRPTGFAALDPELDVPVSIEEAMKRPGLGPEEVENLRQWKEIRDSLNPSTREGFDAIELINKMALEWPIKASRIAFTTATSGDIGAGMIQGIFAAWTNPARWAELSGKSFRAAFDPEFREVQRTANETLINASAPSSGRGGTLYQRVVTGRQIERGFGKPPKQGPKLAMSITEEQAKAWGIPEKERRPSDFNIDDLERVPGIGYWFRGGRRQFETLTEGIRGHAFGDMASLMSQANKADGLGGHLTESQIDNAIQVANHLSGATSAGMHPLAGVLFGAPRFLFSQVALLGDAVSKGGIPGHYARRQLAQTYGTIISATVAANLMVSRGKDWWGPGLGGPQDIKTPEDLQRVMTSPNFGRVRVPDALGLGFGEADVSLFGPMDPMFRTFVKEMWNLQDIGGAGEAVVPGTAVAGFAESKFSPLARMATNAVRGENKYTGAQYDSPMDFVFDNMPTPAPIFAQNIMDIAGITPGEGNVTSSAFEYGGIKSSPLTLSEKAQQVLGSLDDEYWVTDVKTQDFRPPKTVWELSPEKRAKLREEEPAVHNYLKMREKDPSRPFTTKIADEFAAAQTVWDKRLESGQMTTDKWREQFISNQRQMREIRELNGGPGDFEVRTQGDQDLNDYFAIYKDPAVAPEGGSIDYVRAEEAMRSMRSRIGEKRWGEIEERLSWNRSPTVTQYLQDMQTYGNFLDTNPKYEGLDPMESRRADQIADRIRTVQASNPGVSYKYILSVWERDGVITREEAAAATLAVQGKYSDEYDEFRGTEDGVRALKWFKPALLAGEDSALLEGAPTAEETAGPTVVNPRRRSRAGRTGSRSGRTRGRSGSRSAAR